MSDDTKIKSVANFNTKVKNTKADPFRSKLGIDMSSDKTMPHAYTYYHFNNNVIGDQCKYGITPKLDGHRVSLTFDGNNDELMKLRGESDWVPFRISNTGKVPVNVHHLVEGEMINSNNQSFIFIFDCYYDTGSLLELPRKERLSRANTLKGLEIHRTASKGNRTIKLLIKEFIGLDENDNVYDLFAQEARKMIDADNKVTYNNINFKCDGLILQPAMSLEGSTCAGTKVTHRPLKWKPRQYTTVDLEMHIDANETSLKLKYKSGKEASVQISYLKNERSRDEKLIRNPF